MTSWFLASGGPPASLAVAAARLWTPAAWATAAGRWVLFAGLAMALGGLAGRGLARMYKGPAPVPLPSPWALRGSLLGVAAAAALAPVTPGVITVVEVAAFGAAGCTRTPRPGCWSWC